MPVLELQLRKDPLLKLHMLVSKRILYNRIVFSYRHDHGRLNTSPDRRHFVGTTNESGVEKFAVRDVTARGLDNDTLLIKLAQQLSGLGRAWAGS